MADIPTQNLLSVNGDLKTYSKQSLNLELGATNQEAGYQISISQRNWNKFDPVFPLRFRSFSNFEIFSSSAPTSSISILNFIIS